MFAQVAIIALGVVVLAALLWEPWVEGVNANATSIRDIYFDDPFLAYIYFAFVSVFVGLYQAFKLAGNIGRGETYSQHSAQALRTIKHCALTFAGLIVLAVGYIVVVASRTSDDIAGGVAMGLMMIFIAAITAIIAARFEGIILDRI